MSDNHNCFHTILETNMPLYYENGTLIRSYVGMIPSYANTIILNEHPWQGVQYCTGMISIYDLVSKWTMLAYSQRY